MLIVALSILLLGFLTFYDAKEKRAPEDPYDPRRLRLPLRSHQLLRRATMADSQAER